MPSSSTDSTPEVSQRFCAADADITIRSSDGILFHLHKINLHLSFGSWEFSAQGDNIIQLPESAATLDYLFRFCYPERHPDLEQLNFDLLYGVAEATEKYKLHPAIHVCKIRMRDTLPQHAFEVLKYAAKYAYYDIIDMAAPLVVLEVPLSRLLRNFPPDIRVHWALYHEVWQNVVRDAIAYYDTWASSFHDIHPPGQVNCALCGQPPNIEADVNRLLRRLGVGFEALANLDTTFSFCRHVPQRIFSSWRRYVEEGVKRVPLFSSLSEPAKSTAHITATRLAPTPGVPGGGVFNRFNGPGSDVSFQSSDGVVFRIHRINLDICAGGFAPPGIDACEEVVPLSENAVILEFLFRFCYAECHPNVEEMKFDVLALLSEAAEKYQVFSAMNICKIYMKKLVPRLATHILGYAARHDYADILDIAAPHVVAREPLSETLPKLPGDMILRWVRYFESVRTNMRVVRNGGKKQKLPPIDLPAFSTFK